MHKTAIPQQGWTTIQTGGRGKQLKFQQETALKSRLSLLPPCLQAQEKQPMQQTTKSMTLAVPSNNPGGLDAKRSDHFGHCDVFTVVTINGKDITEVNTINNSDHGAGGCMVPVQFLKDNDVETIVVGGIGARPLQGFMDVGIEVFYADRNAAPSVKDVVTGMLEQKFPLIRADQTCSGHGNCH